MFILRIIKFALSLYTLILILNFLLPYMTDTQKPWMTKLNKLCEPALKMGRAMAAKILPDRAYKMDMGAVMAVVVFFLLSIIIGWMA